VHEQVLARVVLVAGMQREQSRELVVLEVLVAQFAQRPAGEPVHAPLAGVVRAVAPIRRDAFFEPQRQVEPGFGDARVHQLVHGGAHLGDAQEHAALLEQQGAALDVECANSRRADARHVVHLRLDPALQRGRRRVGLVIPGVHAHAALERTHALLDRAEGRGERAVETVDVDCLAVLGVQRPRVVARDGRPRSARAEDQRQRDSAGCA
jgi:hypothetical protein